MQNVGNGQRAAAFSACYQILKYLCFVVFCHHNFEAAQFSRCVFSECFHDQGDTFHTFQTFHCQRFYTFTVVAVFFIQCQQCFIQCHAFFFIECSHFTDQNCSVNRVFISCVCAAQTAIAFFEAIQILMGTCFVEAFDLFTDEFEACQNVHFFYAVCFTDRCDHFCRYDCFDDCTVFRQSALFFSLAQDVFCCQRTNMVTCQSNEFALIIFYHSTYTVSIGVCTDQNVSIHFCSQFLCHYEYFYVFRVRVIYCGEGGIGFFLFFYDINVLEACFFQVSANRHVTGTMQRCVNDVQFIAHALDHFRVHQASLYIFVEGFIHFAADQVEQFFRFCFCSVHSLDQTEVCHSVYFCDDAFISGCYYLSTVSPVYFVAVVFRGIMGCCQHYACCAAQFSYCEGQHGNGTQGRINEGRDTIRSEDQTCNFCKFRGHEAGVICNSYAFVLCAFFQDVVCQTLGRFPNCVLVQSVGAVADDAAQTACTKFQFLEEAFFDFHFVISNASQFRFCFVVDKGIVQPLLISYTIVFHFLFLLKCFIKYALLDTGLFRTLCSHNPQNIRKSHIFLRKIAPLLIF